MNRDDVIRLYLQVADELTYGKDWGWGVGENGPLHRFANLVAAAERKACASVCDAIHAKHIAEFGDYIEGGSYATECADAIRARGTHGISD